MKQFRHCTFSVGTIPQTEKEAIDYFNDFYDRKKDSEKFDYMIIALEKGEEGHYHIQGYCYSHTQRLPTTWSNLLDNAYYTKMSRGTVEQNRDYVKKQDHTFISGPLEFGDVPKNQGQRSDIEDFIDAVKEGLSDYELLEQYPVQYLRYENKITKLRNLAKPIDKKSYNIKEVLYLWGSSGTGKTRFYHEKYDMNDVYVLNTYERGCFDNYSNESILVLEEYRGNFNISFLLQLLDGYVIQLPARYHNKIGRFQKVVICTNVPIQSLYKEIDRKSLNALKRRITKTIYFEKQATCYADAIKLFDNKLVKEKTIFEE